MLKQLVIVEYKGYFHQIIIPPLPIVSQFGFVMHILQRIF